MYVKITAAVAALFLLGVSGSAFAGTDASAGSASNAAAGAASKSSSTSGPSSSDSGAQIIDNNVNPKQAPETFVSPSNNTAPCVIAGGFGISGGGWGVGGTGGIKDAGCELRARVELLRSMGLNHAAVALLCDADPRVAAAVTEVDDKCHDTSPEFVPTPPVAPPPPQPPIKVEVTIVPPPVDTWLNDRPAQSQVAPTRPPAHRHKRTTLRVCPTVVKPAVPPACHDGLRPAH